MQQDSHLSNYHTYTTHITNSQWLHAQKNLRSYGCTCVYLYVWMCENLICMFFQYTVRVSMSEVWCGALVVCVLKLYGYYLCVRRGKIFLHVYFIRLDRSSQLNEWFADAVCVIEDKYKFQERRQHSKMHDWCEYLLHNHSEGFF